MSKIINDNFIAGETVSLADTNAKFSDIETATATINEQNVRSEGVDRRTLKAHTYSTGRMEPLVYMDYFSNGVGTSAGAYNTQSGQAAFPLLNGSPTEMDWTALAGGGVTLTDGDIIRIHFGVFLTKHNDPGYDPAGPASSSPLNQSDAVGVVFFPMWDIGAGWATVTNQVNLNNSITAPHSFTIDGSTNRTDGVAWVSLEGWSDVNFMYPARMVHGMLCYKHAGADITIEKLRIHGRGPVVYQNTGAVRSIHVPAWGIGRYANIGLDIPAMGGNNIDIYVAAFQMSATVLRGDS
tara:strand:- start:7 stop:891 length:885 start_codon:yes stop_codon:yes gene_type:complete